jgi:hypothetical protein
MDDQPHLLVNVHIDDLQMDKLGYPRDGLEQSLDEQALHPRHGIGLRNQALFFGPGETGNDALARGWPGEGQNPPPFFGHVARLIIGQAMPLQEFERVRDNNLEPCRLRLCRWSTHYVT